MPTIRNLSAGEVVPQMGFAITQNENAGWDATRDYYMTKDTWEGANAQARFAVGNDIAIADPTVSSSFNFLKVKSKVASYEDSGTIRLSVSYSGSGASQFGGEDGGLLTLDAVPTYRLEGSLRELPFSDHPKWQALEETKRVYLGGLMNGTYETDEFGLGCYFRIGGERYNVKDTSGNNVEFVDDEQTFAKRIGEGQTSYQAPSLTWTEYTQGESGMTPAQIGKLGEISSPRGNPPTVEGYDWMLSGASQEQRGQLYQTTIEWVLSRAGGHDAFLYTSS